MALNKLLTRITSIRELKTIFFEALFNTTSKVTKVSKTSVLNGTAYGITKIAQKSVKDIAVIESQLFPEFAAGQYLDNAARLWQGAERREATGSSTFVIVKASSGTLYAPGTHTFISDLGVEFDITSQVVVGGLGYAYVKVRSVTTGLDTNVDALTINSVNPIPDGHIDCTNEYRAIGGRDAESDEVLRERVTQAINIGSRDTLTYITEILRTFDPDVLKVINTGIDDNYTINLAVVRVNGADYTEVELTDLQQRLIPNLSLSDTLSLFGGGVKLVNVDWFYINGTTGVDFRVDISTNYDIDIVRRNIQVALTKLLDFRFTTKTKILWDDILETVKDVEGVLFVPVEHFNPKLDQTIPSNQLPRIRAFKMRDLSGNILFDGLNRVSPIFYQ
jgi:uncharacterized phage protein gp47/JayE